jgi:hypothetical protein
MFCLFFPAPVAGFCKFGKQPQPQRRGGIFYLSVFVYSFLFETFRRAQREELERQPRGV